MCIAYFMHLQIRTSRFLSTGTKTKISRSKRTSVFPFQPTQAFIWRENSLEADRNKVFLSLLKRVLFSQQKWCFKKLKIAFKSSDRYRYDNVSLPVQEYDHGRRVRHFATSNSYSSTFIKQNFYHHCCNKKTRSR